MRKNPLPQQLEKCMDVHYSPPALTHCPAASIYAQGHEQTSFLIPGGEVNWWHCSVCRGWHVLIVDTGEKS